MFHIPDTFAQNMIMMDEAVRRPWLERLPTILANCEQRWDLTIGPPFDLSFNYVAPAVRRDGTPVVVKVCLPDGTDEFPSQAVALRLCGGQGMVQLLECDESEGVMLLERLAPGTLLSTLEDDVEATSIAASVMRQIWRPLPIAPHPFPSVSDWGKGFTRLRQYYKGGSGPFPADLLERAERLFAELSASMAEPVLLHGDLHHENILAATRQPWLAIDPKGLVGEPAYEPGALLRNQLAVVFEATSPAGVMARRVDQLAAELELDRTRIRDWALAQSVLSAWWCVEDFGESGQFGQEALACAELLAVIKA